MDCIKLHWVALPLTKKTAFIPCQSTPGIPPTGLGTTGFNGIKTDGGIPFHTRGGIPPEALPAKASG